MGIRMGMGMGMVLVVVVCYGILWRWVDAKTLACRSHATPDDRVDHRDVPDHHSDEGLATGPAAGLGGAVGAILGCVSCE